MSHAILRAILHVVWDCYDACYVALYVAFYVACCLLHAADPNLKYEEISTRELRWRGAAARRAMARHVQRDFGLTALHVAAEAGHAEACRALLEAGARSARHRRREGAVRACVRLCVRARARVWEPVSACRAVCDTERA